MEESRSAKAHKITVTNRRMVNLTGVLDVISFDMSDVLLETEQGMLNLKGKDLHVNRLNLEKGEVDVEGDVDVVSYSQVPVSLKKKENLLGKWFK